MTTKALLLATAVMALATYLPRVLPLAIFRRKIQNPFVRSFLIYMPYGILAAMVFPAVLFSTASLISALCGTAVAFVLAWNRRGLLTVAVGATLAVLLAEWLTSFFI